MIPKISQDNEVTIRFTLTEKEYFEALKLNSIFLALLFKNLYFVGLVSLVAYFMGAEITYPKVAGLLVFQFCIANFFMWYCRRKRRKNYQQSEMRQNEIRLKLTKTGIHYDYTTGHGFIEWSHFHVYRYNKKYCLLYAVPSNIIFPLYAAPTMIIFPLSAITSEKRAQLFSLLRRHLVTDSGSWYHDEDDEKLLASVWSAKKRKNKDHNNDKN